MQNAIEKHIAEREKKFDEKFVQRWKKTKKKTEYTKPEQWRQDFTGDDYAVLISPRAIKSHLIASEIDLLRAVVKMMEEKKSWYSGDGNAPINEVVSSLQDAITKLIK